MWMWLVQALGWVVTTVATFFIEHVAYQVAVRYALVTAFLVASAALLVGLTLSMKALIFAARVAMPGSLGLVTYFLPSSLPTMFSFIVTFRLSVFIYRWTVATMASYLPSNPKHGLLL